MSLENTMKAFGARLDEISAHQKFIAGSLKIGKEASKYWDRAALAETGEMSELVDSQRTVCNQVRAEDLGGALSVQLFATVEWFIGQIIVKSVRQVSETVSGYDKLPDAIIRNHVILNGRALSRVYEAPSHERINVDHVFHKLSNCVQGSSKVELNDEVFSFYLPNIDSKSLEKCLLRIGLKLSWDHVGKDKKLQKLFDESSDRKTGKASSAFLDRCAKDRNSIVHRGDGSVTIRLDQLSDQLVFFRCLFISIAKQINKHLSAIK